MTNFFQRLSIFLLLFSTNWVNNFTQAQDDFKATTKEFVIQTSQKVDELYLKMQEVPEKSRSFSTFQNEYREITIMLHTLHSRLLATNKQLRLAENTKKLQNNFDIQKKQHKDAGILSDSDLKVDYDLIRQMLDALILQVGKSHN